MKKRNFKGIPQRKPFRQDNFQAREMQLEQVNQHSVGKIILLNAIIDSVAQTSGPTLFSATDGTGTLTLKGFESPGKRAHPEIKEKDAIQATIQINEFNGSLEGEIKKIQKLSSEETEKLKKLIRETERKKATPKDIDFMIKSPILDKLKDRFIQAATEIRLAVLQNRPIIVRHHNDADGYSSGFALERAILPLIEKHHGPGKAAWEFYTRAPCAAPFYEIDDSIKDTSMSLRNEAKFSNKMPLIIIADNGSTEQDLIAIKQGKVHGIDFIVVDHHYFEKDVISDEVLVHISPFLVGETGDKFSAGMLCTEFARFINADVKNISQIPAMAGFADRTDLANPEAVNAYLKLAEKEGYTRQLLSEIASLIDFASKKLRFMEAREYIEVIFGEPREKQKELVKLMHPYLVELKRKGLAMGLAAATTEKAGETTIQFIELESSLPGFGFYPRHGIVIEMLHDHFLEKNKNAALVTVGVLNTAISIRATDEANFSVHELMQFLDKKAPNAFVDGGGHKNAGSITFIPNQKENVLKLLKEFVKGR